MLESCSESCSNNVLLFMQNTDQLFHNLGKYDIRNNPMRIMVCVANALIENASCNKYELNSKY